MGLAFTDTQIKDMTKDTLLLPFIINDPNTGLIAQKNMLNSVVGGLLSTDESQKIFTDYYEIVQQKYHEELALLNNIKRTDYNDADLVLGGKGDGPHFSNGWKPFTPKLIDSNIGLPVTTLSNNLERFHSDLVKMVIETIKNGFNDSSFSTSVTISGSSFYNTSGFGSLAVGHRVLLANGSQAFVVKVDSITSSTVTGPPPVTTYTATYTTIFGSVFSGSASASSNMAGFSDSQRNGSVTTSPRTYIYSMLTSSIDSLIVNWKNYIQALVTILNANGDLQPRKARIDSANYNCNNALSFITIWESKPSATTIGRFTDATLAPIEALITTREAYTPNRVAEVIADLGSATQSQDGSFTTSGVYGELIRNIDMRIAKGAGSLYKYNDAGLGTSFIDKKIATANAQLAQLDNIFAITKLLSDTVVGQTSFEVESVTGFVLGDSVKLMDNASIVYTRTITQITGSIIKVNSGIPVVLTKGAMSRISKFK